VNIGPSGGHEEVEGWRRTGFRRGGGRGGGVSSSIRRSIDKLGPGGGGSKHVQPVRKRYKGSLPGSGFRGPYRGSGGLGAYDGLYDRIQEVGECQS